MSFVFRTSTGLWSLEGLGRHELRFRNTGLTTALTQQPMADSDKSHRGRTVSERVSLSYRFFVNPIKSDMWWKKHPWKSVTEDNRLRIQQLYYTVTAESCLYRNPAVTSNMSAKTNTSVLNCQKITIMIKMTRKVAVELV